MTTSVQSKCLGVVLSIRSQTIKVGLPNGTSGSINITQISDSLNQYALTDQNSPNKKLDLEKFFKVGDLVKCSILSTSSNGHTSECSLKPSLFNPSNLAEVVKPDLPVLGEFKSKEDNGWQISFGQSISPSLESNTVISGFIAFDALQDADYIPQVGMVKTFLVKSFNSRVATLETSKSLKVLDSNSLSETASSQLSWLNSDPENPNSVSIDSILPGQTFTPQSVRQHKSGFLVTFLDDFSANLSMLDCPDEYLHYLVSVHTDSSSSLNNPSKSSGKKKSKAKKTPKIPLIRIIKVDSQATGELPRFFCSAKPHLLPSPSDPKNSPHHITLLSHTPLDTVTKMYAKYLIGSKTKAVFGPISRIDPKQKQNIDPDADSDSDEGWDSDNDDDQDESTAASSSSKVKSQSTSQTDSPAKINIFIPPSHFPINETLEKSRITSDSGFFPKNPDKILPIRITKVLHIEQLYQASNHPDIIEAHFTKPSDIKPRQFVRAMIIAQHENVLLTVLDPFFIPKQNQIPQTLAPDGSNSKQTKKPRRGTRNKIKEASASRVLSSHIQVRAIIPKNQLSDNVPVKSEQTTKVLEKKYHKHKFLICRVLFIDNKTHKIVLSHKSSFLTNNFEKNGSSGRSSSTKIKTDASKATKPSLSLFKQNLGLIPQDLKVGSILSGKVVQNNNTWYKVVLWNKPRISGILSIAAISDAWPEDHSFFKLNSNIYVVVLAVSQTPNPSDPSKSRYSIQLGTAPSLFRHYNFEANSHIDPLTRSKITSFFTKFPSGFDLDQETLESNSPKLDGSKISVGSKLPGYITSHAPKRHFLFISLGPLKTCRAICHLKNLSDGYTPKDSLERLFPIGKKVVCTVLSVSPKKGIQVSLRSNPLKPIEKIVYTPGSIVKGRVSKIASSGTCLWIEFSGNYVAKVYKRMLLEEIDPEYNLGHHYSKGNIITAVITKVDPKKKSLFLNCKPSAISKIQRGAALGDIEHLDVTDASLPPMRGKRDRGDSTVTAPLLEEGVESEEEEESDSDDEDAATTTTTSSTSASAPKNSTKIANRLQQLKKRKNNQFLPEELLSDSDDDDDDDDDDSSKSTLALSKSSLKNRGKRTKEKLKKQEEASIAAFEKEKMDSEWKPTTAVHFESSILENPNNSISWLKYAVYFLEMGEIQKSRGIFSRATKTIDPSHSKDIDNIWIGWINMEHEFGTPHQLSKVKDEALKYADPLSIHMHLISLAVSRMEKELKSLESSNPLRIEAKKRFHITKIVETFEKLLKNKSYKTHVLQLWKPYLKFLLSQKMVAEADSIYARCVQPLSSNKLDTSYNLKKKKQILSIYIFLLKKTGYSDRASTLEAQL